MKKVLIVTASKRRKGNSYTLAKRIGEQLDGKAEVTTFHIGEKDVRACLACDACKRQHTPNCIQRDDFTALIPEIDSCDAMLILSPVHWDHFQAQLKAFLDRTEHTQESVDLIDLGYDRITRSRRLATDIKHIHALIDHLLYTKQRLIHGLNLSSVRK